MAPPMLPEAGLGGRLGRLSPCPAGPCCAIKMIKSYQIRAGSHGAVCLGVLGLHCDTDNQRELVMSWHNCRNRETRAARGQDKAGVLKDSRLCKGKNRKNFAFRIETVLSLCSEDSTSQSLKRQTRIEQGQIVQIGQPSQCREEPKSRCRDHFGSVS